MRLVSTLLGFENYDIASGYYSDTVLKGSCHEWVMSDG